MKKVEEILNKLGYRYQVNKEGDKTLSLSIPAEYEGRTFNITCSAIGKPLDLLVLRGVLLWKTEGLTEGFWEEALADAASFPYGRITLLEGDTSFLLCDAVIPSAAVTQDSLDTPLTCLVNLLGDLAELAERTLPSELIQENRGYMHGTAKHAPRGEGTAS